MPEILKQEDFSKGFKRACFEFPAKIKSILEQQGVWIEELMEIKEAMKKIETKQMLEIMEATDKAGKPEYRNELMRQQELIRRLEIMPEYGGLDTRRVWLEREMRKFSIDLEFARNSFELCKIYGRV